MLTKENEATRLLCASAFLAGPKFRYTVMQRFEEIHQAPAPEIGADFKLVAQVCRGANLRALRYAAIFAILPIVALIIFATIVPEVAFVLIILLAIAAGVLFFIKTYQERYSLIQPFTRENFDPAKVAAMYPPYFSHAKAGAVAQEDQNLVIYKDFVPFVGAGIDIGGWSFAVSTIKASNGLLSASQPIIPFTASDLYLHIEDALVSLDIPEMQGDDFFFVSGADIRSHQEILPNPYVRPESKLKPETAAEYKDQCHPHIRHYHWIRVHDWGGEIVMSMFLRCTLRGSNLFVEMKKFLLTPLADQYRKVDTIARPTFGVLVSLFIGCLIAAPFYSIYAILFLLTKGSIGLGHMLGSEERKAKEEIRNNPLYNYGVDKSLRTTFSSGNYRHYFQKLDTDFYSRVLEQEILDSIVTFLSDHNIDTSDFKERKNTILNSGIIVQSGNVNAESLAVGAGAKAIKAGIGAFKKAATGAEA